MLKRENNMKNQSANLMKLLSAFLLCNSASAGGMVIVEPVRYQIEKLCMVMDLTDPGDNRPAPNSPDFELPDGPIFANPEGKLNEDARLSYDSGEESAVEASFVALATEADVPDTTLTTILFDEDMRALEYYPTLISINNGLVLRSFREGSEGIKDLGTLRFFQDGQGELKLYEEDVTVSLTNCAEYTTIQSAN